MSEDFRQLLQGGLALTGSAQRRRA